MDKNSNSKTFRKILDPMRVEHPSKYWSILAGFFDGFEAVIRKKNLDFDHYQDVAVQYANAVLFYLKNPPTFRSFHQAVREPVDYYQIGLELFRPLVNFSKSTLREIETLKQIESYLKSGENVIFYANHQIESDPQVISLLLEKDFSHLAETMIFVAGARVLKDALAAPTSLGRNLFCIYSKKYFNIYKERHAEMLKHNQKTLQAIVQQLKLGGKCIYLAPSGGRDRPNQKGIIEIAKFDPQSVELMYLLGLKSKKPTHYFPLALSTHSILPPPKILQVELGEDRLPREAPIHLHFGKEIDMDNFPGSDTTDKKKRKQVRTEYIQNLVCELYRQFPN